MKRTALFLFQVQVILFDNEFIVCSSEIKYSHNKLIMPVDTNQLLATKKPSSVEI